MATNYPTSLDSLTDPLATDPMSAPEHDDQHTNVNDAIEAMQAKMGVDDSDVVTSFDYRINQLEDGYFSQTENSVFIELYDETNDDSVYIKTGTGDPNTVVSGELGSLFLASDTGKTWRNNNGGTQWVEFATGTSSAHIARMRRNASQGIGSTWTKINFDTEDFDVGGIADPTTNNRFDISRTGKYFVSARLIMDGGGETTGKVAIYKNGAILASSELYCSEDTDIPLIISEVFELTSGDYLEMYAEDTDMSTTAHKQPTMTVCQVDAVTGNAAGGWTDNGSYVGLTDSSDKVLIGSGTPLYNLHIIDGTNPSAEVQDTTNDCIVKMQALDTWGLVGTRSNHDFTIYVNNDRKVTVDTSGQMGINQISPSEMLDVVGDIEVSADIHHLSDNGKSYFGAADDASIYYDGTDLKIDPQEVGSGLLNVLAPAKIEGSIKILEQASADGDTAGYGQLWVKSTTPCELWFTNDAGTDTQLGTGGAAASSAEWGDASDGNVTISTNTTLTANMQYDTLTINSGIELKTDGYIIQANKIVFGSGTSKIVLNGNDGSNGSAGSSAYEGQGTGRPGGAGGAGGAAVGDASAPLPQGLAGRAGGNGGSGGNWSGDAPGSLGAKSNGTDVSNGNGSDGVAGSRGGYSGNPSSGGAGGDAGEVSVDPAEMFALFDRYPYLHADYDYFGGSATAGGAQGGAGSPGNNYWGMGGSGGSGAGGGGSCGGVIYIAAKEIEGAGLIESIGGDAGNGANGVTKTSGNHPSSGSGGGAGGSGGTGGVIVIIYNDISSWTGDRTDVSGGSAGTAGSGGASGGQAGVAGIAGADGKVFYFKRPA